MTWSNELWRFDTERFSVVCTAEEEFDIDLSWDDDGSAARGIKSGEFDIFCAKVAVYLDGVEIASDYLGSCIYRPGEFVTSHRDPDPLNRNCSLNPANIGHYFPDMVATAIDEARRFLASIPEFSKPRHAA